jgi:hypothetical protein
MRRSTSIVVWIPHEKAYLVTDASKLEYYRHTIPIDLLRERETDIREYVAVSASPDDARICSMVN